MLKEVSKKHNLNDKKILVATLEVYIHMYLLYAMKKFIICYEKI